MKSVIICINKPTAMILVFGMNNSMVYIRMAILLCNGWNPMLHREGSKIGLANR